MNPLFNKNQLITLVFFIIVAITVIFAKNRYTTGDSKATLLVSESIINTGSVKLDQYGHESLKDYMYVKEIRGHEYNYFPLGTSIAAIPFVLVAKPFGFSAIKYTDYNSMQIILAVITSVITVFIMIIISSEFLSFNNALMITAAFWFGTSLSSTCGTALWSHNFAVVFAFLSILLSIKSTKDNVGRLWIWIGVALFMSFLCRATMAVLSPLIILYLFSYKRELAYKVALVTSGLVTGFIIYSYHEFSQYLPDYYLSNRLTNGSYIKALYGHILSPSRGMLIYSSFIGILFLGLFKYKNIKLKKTWLLIGLLWPLIHLLTICKFPDYWSGWSFGPRFLTDVLPGLFLLGIHAWPVSIKSILSRLFIGILTLSISISVCIHTGQGLFNTAVYKWNTNPNIDQFPDRIFDWKHPQFLASPEGRSEKRIK